MTILLIATSPRSTWVTCPDEATFDKVRDLLADRCWPVDPYERPHPLSLDLDIGVDAGSASDVLLANGFVFQWHPDRPKLDPDATAWGLPVHGVGTAY